MKCALYCRLSREDDEKEQESESIQNQKSLLTYYADQQNWHIYRIYCDEDFSGIDRSRPGFLSMIEDAQQHKFDIVLCKSQSRFTRDMELVEKYIHNLFPIWGIRFVTIVDHVDTWAKGTKKSRQINGLINEWYLEDLSDNIKTVLNDKRRKGEYIGGFPTYGYQKDPQNHNHLVVDPEAAQIVRQIYLWYLQGYGKQKIADLLNQNGIPNPTVYKQNKGQHYVNGMMKIPSSLWNRTTIGRILKNEMYVGTMVQGRQVKPSYKSKKIISVSQEHWFRVEHTHEAIIDDDIFQRVQKQMEQKRRSDGSGISHPLAGKVFCMSCGRAMNKVSNWRNEKQYSYLRCPQPNFCDGNHSICFTSLLQMLLEKIQQYLVLYYTPDRNVFEKSAAKETLICEQKIRSLQAQREKYVHAIQALYLDKTEGIITQDQFVHFNREFLNEKQILEDQIKTLIKRIEDPPKVQQTKKDINLTSIASQLLPFVINRIEIGKKDNHIKTQKVHIFWNF